MSKWSNLMGGKSAIAEEKTFGLSTFIVAALVAVGLVVVLVVVFSKKNSTNSVKQAPMPVEAALTIVQEKVASVPEPTVEAVAVAPIEDAIVEPKKSIRNPYFDDVQSESIQFDNVTYDDFEKIFTSERRNVKVDKPFDTNQEIFQSLRQKIRSSGLNVQNYIDTHNIQIADDLFEALVHDTGDAANQVVENIAFEMDSESMLLAREALQPVSLQGPVDVVVQTLREILAARTEAQRLGLSLPEMPEEQQHAIRMWSTKKGPASDLAKTILSRL